MRLPRLPEGRRKFRSHGGKSPSGGAMPKGLPRCPCNFFPAMHLGPNCSQMEHVLLCVNGLSAVTRAAAKRGEACASFTYDPLPEARELPGTRYTSLRYDREFHAQVRQAMVNSGIAADVDAWYSYRTGNRCITFTAWLPRRAAKDMFANASLG